MNSQSSTTQTLPARMSWVAQFARLEVHGGISLNVAKRVYSTLQGCISMTD